MARAPGRCVLTGPGAFEAVFRTGRKREGEFVQLVAAPSAREGGRVGFVIGRKALPLAVERNRLRRMLRVALVEARDSIGGLDVIVRIKRGVPKHEFAAIVADARRLLELLVAQNRSA